MFNFINYVNLTSRTFLGAMIDRNQNAEHNGSNMKCTWSRGGAREHFVPENGGPKVPKTL